MRKAKIDALGLSAFCESMAMMLVIIAAVLGVMLAWVLPMFAGVYEGMAGSLLTSVFKYIYIAEAICWIALGVMLLTAVVLLVGQIMWSGKKGRAALAGILEKLPALSDIMACTIDRINRSRHGHIITMEDPIEHVHHGSEPVRPLSKGRYLRRNGPDQVRQHRDDAQARRHVTQGVTKPADTKCLRAFALFIYFVRFWPKAFNGITARPAAVNGPHNGRVK